MGSEPVMKMQKTQSSDEESIFEEMGADLAKALESGVAHMVRYRDKSKLPIAVAACPYQFDGDSGDRYIVVMTGFVCRRADLERFFQDDYKPCFDRIVAASDKITDGETAQD